MAAVTEQQIQKTEPQAVAPMRKPLPMVPTNMEEAWRVSEALAKSSLVPQHYQGKPENILAAFFMAADLGISGMQAMREIYVVHGVPRASAALKVALVKQSTECLVWECTETTREKATFRTHRRGDPKPTTLTFTLEQAKLAGLYPGKPDSGWAKWPENMLRARAASFLADLVYPDVVKGLRTSEEFEGVEEKEVGGERVFPETSAPPPPPVAQVVESPKAQAAAPVRAPSVAAEQPPVPQEAKPEATVASGTPDPVDVLLAELEQVDALPAVDAISKRAGDLLPKGHPRRNEVGTALNAARRRLS